jgi:hypothetical protein
MMIKSEVAQHFGGENTRKSLKLPWEGKFVTFEDLKELLTNEWIRRLW